MNRNSKSPSRKKKSPARKEKDIESPRRSLRDRSRSRGRIYEDEVLNEFLGKEPVAPRSRSKSRRSPARKTPTKAAKSPKRPAKVKPAPKSEPILRKSASADRDEVIRNSMSRFDDIVSEAVVTVKRSTRSMSNNKVQKEFKEELEKEVKTLLVENNLELLEEKPEREFGGWFGALILIFVLPILVLLLQVSCIKDACSMKGFKVSLIWRKYVDSNATLWYLGYIMWQVILSCLPIGTRGQDLSNKYVPFNYRCNGFFNLLLTGCALYLLKYMEYDITEVIDKTIPLLVTAIGTAIIISVALYIKGHKESEKTNIFGNTGNVIYDFFVGREVNPRVGPLDIKLTLIKSSLISAIVYNGLLILRSATKESEEYPWTLIVVCSLQTIYLLDFLLFESSFLSSFSVQREGLGYALVMASAVFPFFITLIPKYIFYISAGYCLQTLIGAVILYFIGHALFRISNSQKAEVRKESPRSSRISGLETMSTIEGKKLLCGGLWGSVRHPNYVGSLLMIWSWALACLALPFHFLPYSVPVFMTVFFVHRCLRDYAYCNYRYGVAWKRYVDKVKYHLIPKVF